MIMGRFRLQQNFRRFCNIARVGAAGRALHRLVVQRTGKFFDGDVAGYFHHHRPRTAQLEIGKGAPHDFRHLIGDGDFFDPF